MTFPVLHVMRTGSEADQGRIRELAAQETIGESDMAEVKAIVERHGAVAATMELVRTYLKKAKASLGSFSDSAAKRSLVLMVDFIGDRDW